MCVSLGGWTLDGFHRALRSRGSRVEGPIGWGWQSLRVNDMRDSGGWGVCCGVNRAGSGHRFEPAQEQVGKVGSAAGRRCVQRRSDSARRADEAHTSQPSSHARAEGSRERDSRVAGRAVLAARARLAWLTHWLRALRRVREPRPRAISELDTVTQLLTKINKGAARLAWVGFL